MSAEYVFRGRVAWVDTDAGGRIHFTAAFRYAEAAETGLMREAGLLEGWGDFPRRHVEADFLKVLRFEDEFEVRIRVERLGTSSIGYVWEVAKNGEVYVEGRHTAVHVDRDGRSEPVPAQIRTALSS